MENKRGRSKVVFDFRADSRAILQPWGASRGRQALVESDLRSVPRQAAEDVPLCPWSDRPRAPWANAPFIPGSLGDYMDAQFRFFGSDKIADDKRPVLAGLNYFLTDQARGGDSPALLGEKRDVKVWMGWLERLAHGDVDVIETPIGNLPKYQDLKDLFKSIIDKEYPEDLYVKQFSLYIDNINYKTTKRPNDFIKRKTGQDSEDVELKVLKGQG